MNLNKCRFQKLKEIVTKIISKNKQNKLLKQNRKIRRKKIK